MKLLPAITLLAILVSLTSCGSHKVPVAQLSQSEQSLLRAVNRYRVSLGKAELKPFVDLTDFAREDAGRRVTSGGAFIDHRQRTGYESMLTLEGKATAGPDFGNRLMAIWQKNPIQRRWLEGNHSGIGAGTATGAAGIQTGVLLLAGFAGCLLYTSPSPRDRG